MEEGRGNVQYAGWWNTWLICLDIKLGNHTAVSIYCFGDSNSDQSLILCDKLHSSRLLYKDWGPRAVRAMQCPYCPTSCVPQPPVRWAGLGKGWWRGWPQPGHPQALLQALSPARKAVPRLGQCQVSTQSDTVQGSAGKITVTRQIQGVPVCGSGTEPGSTGKWQGMAILEHNCSVLQLEPILRASA